ncbi:MAG TPA: hypothetical protein VGK99_20505 [Acidobacteriota bacterium]|jgi:hypothetical protein
MRFVRIISAFFFPLCFYLSSAPDLLAQAPSIDEQVIFPIAVDLLRSDVPIHRTLYGFLNLGPGEFQPRMQFFSSNGGNFLSTGASAVPVNGMVEFPRELDIVVLEHNGWARTAVPAGQRVLVWASISTFQFRPGGVFEQELTGTTRLDAVRPARRFRAPFFNASEFRRRTFGYIAPNGGAELRRTAYAVVNASADQPALIRVDALDRQGKPLCSTSLTILPLARRNFYIPDFFPNCDPGSEGSVLFDSNTPIAVGAVDVFFPEGKFLGVPVVAEP